MSYEGPIVMFHGTSVEAAEEILRSGFAPGTYFAHHLEDALHMGGKYIFHVIFEKDPTKCWEFITRELVPPERILMGYTLTPALEYYDKSAARKMKELNIKAEHGDSMVICDNCDGRGQMEDYPPFTNRADRITCTVCPVCKAHGKLPVKTP